jgi:group I intron endonuclease
MSSCGIYEIVHVATGHKYIGQSVDVYRRWEQHRRDLQTGQHVSSRLQLFWSTHEGRGFDFRIVELCKRHELVAREQFHIDAAGNFLLNVNMTATPSVRADLTDEERRVSMVLAWEYELGRCKAELAQLEKIEARHKNKRGYSEPMSGRELRKRIEWLNARLFINRDDYPRRAAELGRLTELAAKEGMSRQDYVWREQLRRDVYGQICEIEQTIEKTVRTISQQKPRFIAPPNESREAKSIGFFERFHVELFTVEVEAFIQLSYPDACAMVRKYVSAYRMHDDIIRSWHHYGKPHKSKGRDTPTWVYEDAAVWIATELIGKLRAVLSGNLYPRRNAIG